MTTIDEAISVWTSDDGVPMRVVWRATRYRVTDTPTVWAGTCGWWRPFEPGDFRPGAAPLEIGGWRFQATDERGEARVFDVKHDDRLHRWRLVRVFD